LTSALEKRETADALSQPAPPRDLGISTWIRIVGLSLAILYGIGGVVLGLAQQAEALPSEQIDCPYRVSLLRDRVVALTERSPHDVAADPQDNVVSNLIRETQRVCAPRDAESTVALAAIAQRLSEHLELRAREAQTRRELLAIQPLR
jgi:hypothetical protein